MLQRQARKLEHEEPASMSFLHHTQCILYSPIRLHAGCDSRHCHAIKMIACVVICFPECSLLHHLLRLQVRGLQRPANC